MGYSVDGSGTVKLKKNLGAEEMQKLIEASKKLESLDYFDIKEELLSFSEYDSHWHEDDTMKFLNALIPYITEGCVEYKGEDDCHWRYIYDAESNSWKEEGGRIVYGLDSFTTTEIIAELKKRGYGVVKENDK